MELAFILWTGIISILKQNERFQMNYTHLRARQAGRCFRKLNSKFGFGVEISLVRLEGSSTAHAGTILHELYHVLQMVCRDDIPFEVKSPDHRKAAMDHAMQDCYKEHQREREYWAELTSLAFREFPLTEPCGILWHSVNSTGRDPDPKDVKEYIEKMYPDAFKSKLGQTFLIVYCNYQMQKMRKEISIK